LKNNYNCTASSYSGAVVGGCMIGVQLD